MSWKPKHQRMALLGVALVALVGAVLLAMWGLRSQASYFYVPAQVESDPPAVGQNIRLGGMVLEGSLGQADDGVSILFTVHDGEAQVPVRYRGILPDLFVEGSGVVAEGRFTPDGTFVADTLLAKHDENYVPRELEEMTAAQAKAAVAETTK
ncbi:MAG: cytochrome c maturation protein CcmE [Sphingomonadales bacterium CG12_big_fil_rev_8_21_14_0_65_65_10]|nr:MAG: cytochrome c maturation protein CcmE [Sphingomonadales bacterium CG12_big_fil_rev_8_21_14_0_65_65_10]